MGQFKPMVKMMTNEPSVILKLKKGGKVANKADGGFMPMATPQPAPAMGLPARGGSFAANAPMKPSMAMRRKAMMGAAVRPPMAAPPAAMPPASMNPNMMKKGGKASSKHEDAAQDRAMIKKAMAGKKFADGGKIDAVMDKTTIKGNASKFLKTKVVDGDKNDSVKGTGKGVKNGNDGGYANGGTITGNAGKFLKTKVVDGDKNDSAKSSGKGVKMGNDGGYAAGGTIKGGDWENKPADTAKPGKSGSMTGGVRKGNAGGYMEGGSAKKAYATGGTVDTGKPVAMPKKHVSRPIANSLQSGTFAKGGKVTDWTVLNPSLKQKHNRVNAPVEKEEKPNLRLLKTHTGPKGHVAKVYKDRDWGEHRVKFFSPEGKHHTAADYHTDDASEAHETAMSQVAKGYAKGGKAKKYRDGDSVESDSTPSNSSNMRRASSGGRC
jgi:hypothetical protein